MMLNVGTARADVHKVTWTQFDEDNFEYSRQKTGVEVAMTMAKRCRDAVYALPRKHVTVLNTELGKPFTVDGFSSFMRDAINAAGPPLGCRPHGLQKTLGRRLADRGVSAHDIMAALGTPRWARQNDTHAKPTDGAVVDVLVRRLTIRRRTKLPKPHWSV